MRGKNDINYCDSYAVWEIACVHIIQGSILIMMCDVPHATSELPLFGMGGGKEGCDTISTTAKTSKPLPKLQPKPIAKKVGITYLDLQTSPEDKIIFASSFSQDFLSRLKTLINFNWYI